MIRFLIFVTVGLGLTIWGLVSEKKEDKSDWFFPGTNSFIKLELTVRPVRDSLSFTDKNVKVSAALLKMGDIVVTKTLIRAVKNYELESRVEECVLPINSSLKVLEVDLRGQLLVALSGTMYGLDEASCAPGIYTMYSSSFRYLQTMEKS